ncbi:MAG: glycosyltransferase family 39 protein [Pirellulales bacterium]|nr:glycosyltransferase family 39 protein [Pirellulales bacterium]
MTDAEQNPNSMSPGAKPFFTVGLVVVLLVALAVRLVAIGSPLLGNFATKNVVYAMIARNLVEGRASFWLPRVDCLCGSERGLHLLELPLSAYLAGGLWHWLGGSLEVWGRAVSIGFSLAAVWVLYDLTRRRHGNAAALGAAMVLALSPVAVIYGQHFMLEASVVFFAVATIGALDRWLAGRRPAWLAAAVICFGLLVMTKIYMLILLLPIGYLLLAEGLGIRDWGLGVGQAVPDGKSRFPSLIPNPQSLSVRHSLTYGAVLLFILAALPAVAWVVYVMHAAAPGGSLAGQVFYSLRDSAGAHRPPDPLLARPDFYRQVFDDMAGVVFTPVAFMLPLVGLLDRTWRRWAAWLAAMGLLVLIMPRKFFEMNYYWLVVLPPAAILTGLGWARLAERLRPSRMAIAALLALAAAVSFRYTAGPLLLTPEEDRAVLPAAEAVRSLTGPGEPVATMHGSGIDLLYYCDRPGWALAPNEPRLADRLAECGRAGARLLVIVDVAEAESPDRDGRLIEKTPIAQGDGFRVYAMDAPP